MFNSTAKVLFLSYDGLTDPLGQSQILPYLCGLSLEFSISIISFEKIDRYQKNKKLISNICQSKEIDWYPKIYHKSPPVLSTLFDLFILKRSAVRLNMLKSFQIVHCRSYLTSLVGLHLKRKYGIKFIFDMRGFWADERVDGGLWKLSNPLYKNVFAFFKKKEKQFIFEADEIIALTDNAKNEILKWRLNKNIQVIPCCVDLDHFNPAHIRIDEQENLRRELGIKKGEFVLLYLGSLGTWYLLKEMLDFFAELKKKIPNARFLFLTPDAFITEDYLFKRDIILKNSPRQNVPLYISLANASVMFIKPTFSKKASSATKMAEVLAMGIPVITNTGWGDVDEFKNILSGILTVSDNNSYPTAIRSLLNLQDSEKIRHDAGNLFSLSNGIKMYAHTYEKAISQKSGNAY